MTMPVCCALPSGQASWAHVLSSNVKIHRDAGAACAVFVLCALCVHCAAACQEGVPVLIRS
jgi:hypothetical protein